MDDFNLMAITVTPNNTSGYDIEKIGRVSLFGNEEFGTATSIFRCEKFPESFKEFSLDMLSLFNLIKSVKANEIRQYKPFQFVKLNLEHESFREMCNANEIIYMNYMKKSYFLLSELLPWHSYLPNDFKASNGEGILKSTFFINNLLVASVKYDVFLIAFLWNASQNNQMYYFINMYKIQEIMCKTKFEETLDDYVLSLEKALREQLKKSKKYLGDFANNPGSSGIFSRHGGEGVGNSVTSVNNMICYTNEQMLQSIRLYFCRITM
uniref:hypothetical protein n=1 Tax=Candidatus Enterococcus willemsii TaxID=1857215 RepID=UPI00403F51A9